MKLMKAKLVSSMLILLSNIGYAQYTSIPDTNFEQTLIDLNIDTEGTLDGQVLTADISDETSLVMVIKGIADLTGIEDFTSLQTLNVWGNVLGTLDVSNNVNLTTLICNNCSLTTLTIPTSSLALNQITCFNNNLTNLDVSGLDNLSILECHSQTGTGFGTIDLQNNTMLSTLNAWDCGLNSLDVSKNESLYALRVEQNNLSELDLSNNTLLQYLEVDFNPLTGLDLSTITQLNTFNAAWCNLQRLNLKNGHNDLLFNVDVSNNGYSELCIQVDTNPPANVSGWNKDVSAMYSTDCSNDWTLYIPDSSLESALYVAYLNAIDQDMDGLISFSEAAAYNGTLDLSNQGITDVTGLQAFTGVTEINVSGNSISDLSPLYETNAVIISKTSGSYKTMASLAPSALQVLNCSNNSLISLDVSSINTLTTLDCSNNQLLYLNVQNNGSLTTFNATSNDSGLCINVDDAIAADAGNDQYVTWQKDAAASYSSSCTVLNVNKNNLNNMIKVYPNPSHSFINVDVKVSVVYRLVNLQGQELFKGNLLSGVLKLDISTLSKGLYLLSIESSNEKLIKKIIKQ